MAALNAADVLKRVFLQLILSFNGRRSSLLSWLNGGHEVVLMNRKECLSSPSLITWGQLARVIQAYWPRELSG